MPDSVWFATVRQTPAAFRDTKRKPSLCAVETRRHCWLITGSINPPEVGARCCCGEWEWQQKKRR